MVITDTVGFIRDLPKALINAFKATLEESQDADLLIHVVDISDPLLDNQIKSVEDILAEMDLLGHERIILFNKADKVDLAWQQELCERYNAYAVSALEQKTLRPILQLVERRLWHHENPDDALPIDVEVT